MQTLLSLLICMVLLVLVVGCKQEEEDSTHSVRYFAEGGANAGTTYIKYRNEYNAINEFGVPGLLSSPDWERTIYNIESGFRCYLSVDNNMGPSTSRIFVDGAMVITKSGSWADFSEPGHLRE